MSDDHVHHADDEALSALIDGELPADQAERLRQRLADEPELAARLEALRRADALVREACSELFAEPLPAQVVARLSSAQADVVALRPRIKPRWLELPHAIAAGIALAIGIVIGAAMSPRNGPETALAFVPEGGVVDERSALYAAFQQTPSSETRQLGAGLSATPRLSFLSRDGRYCRRVDLVDARGSIETLGCKADGRWRLSLVTFAGRGADVSNGAYQPAGGESSREMEAAIDSLIDGAPLDAGTETELISQHWSAAPP